MTKQLVTARRLLATAVEYAQILNLGKQPRIANQRFDLGGFVRALDEPRDASPPITSSGELSYTDIELASVFTYR